MNQIPIPPIQTTQQYRYFLDSLASEYTKKTYAHALTQFFDYIKNPDISLIVGRESKVIESQVIEYIMHLKQKGLSRTRINVVLAAISHFYTMNDVALNRKKIARFMGKKAVKTWGERGRGYTREQISQILTMADERTGAIILFLASTGIRIGALPSMKLKHLKSVNTSITVEKSPQPTLYQISVYDGEYFTYCTPEATNAINAYLEYRTRSGEKLGPESPIIREQFERDDTLKVRHPKAVSQSSMVSLLTETLTKAGVRQRDHLTEDQTPGKSRKEIPLAHGFRKFFNTALMNADVHPSFKKLLMGHSVQLDEVYYDKGSDKSRAKLLE